MSRVTITMSIEALHIVARLVPDASLLNEKAVTAGLEFMQAVEAAESVDEELKQPWTR